MIPLSRRTLLRHSALAALAFGMPAPVAALLRSDPDEERLTDWTRRLRMEGLAKGDSAMGRSAARIGEYAVGTPYEPGTLEAYLRAGGNPLDTEPLTLSLTRFDCVTLVESCLAVARLARGSGAESAPAWTAFGDAIERMRYRGGIRGPYSSRLHYFSEWISDGARRGLLLEMGAELGGVVDSRPLRFMSEHRESYPALANDRVFAEIGAMERRLDGQPRYLVPAARIPEIADRIETGDVLAFATAIPGLDVTHAALAHRAEDGVLRVLHAPLSGGVVQVTRTTLPEYVAAIRRSTGVMVARPVWG